MSDLNGKVSEGCVDDCAGPYALSEMKGEESDAYWVCLKYVYRHIDITRA